MFQTQWQIPPAIEVPQWFAEAVKEHASLTKGNYLTRLLWQRGIRDLKELAGFLNPEIYVPTSPFAFGQEIKRAVRRLDRARQNGEKIAIWGDFDADGVTATSLLWEGLGQFFTPYRQLGYYIPNRLKESHGLNVAGIEKLVASGTKLLVTCDTGSTNLKEIDYANQLGLDIIVTDHHTLPSERPPVLSIINPRYFAETHPLYNLSGVAVAYKLIEALYLTFPDIPEQPLEDLLDLVAIGLIADLVKLSGDCRNLAQLGIEKLQKQMHSPTRPGIAELLKLCKNNGDRPTDISFGLGPRINAIGRIQGDASFCVELLTTRDCKRAKELAIDTELANTRRKALQQKIQDRAREKLQNIDLSTTCVIVLEDSQWEVGVLGLVAAQIARESGRPAILLSSVELELEGVGRKAKKIARGSARSVNDIDLYESIKSQEHLLESFGGHPFAAGLSIAVENIPLFREGIERQLREKIDIASTVPIIAADAIVTVAELGQDLFRELKFLEPCGMGNPIPKLLIQNCIFKDIRNLYPQDLRGNKIRCHNTTFKIWDETVTRGFPGVWWDHSQEELPQNRACDAIVELDYKNVSNGRGEYQVRLIAVRERFSSNSQPTNSSFEKNSILDWRDRAEPKEQISDGRLKILNKCPLNWDDLQAEYSKARASNCQLALAYPSPTPQSPSRVWEQLVGIAKYLHRTGASVTLEQIQNKLDLSERVLNLGIEALAALGFTFELNGECPSVNFSHAQISFSAGKAIAAFEGAVEEEQFQRQYFSSISLSTLCTILERQGFCPQSS